MSKTPVSILQELMVKKCVVPTYELVHNGGGSHLNTFAYRVTCDGLCATGNGRSKKEAKQEAAQAMLETIAAHQAHLPLPPIKEESPVRTPLPQTLPETPKVSPNVPFVNAIGALQDLCAENDLSTPEYTQISEVGPPHAKIFTIQCAVTTFKEIGIAKTKKQAKQDAAKKMLKKIHDLVDELNETHIPSEVNVVNSSEDVFAKKACEQYILSSKLHGPKKINLGVRISDYHLKLKESIDDTLCISAVEKLKLFNQKISAIDSLEQEEDILTAFKYLLSTINFSIVNIDLPVDKKGVYLSCMKINTVPDIVEVSMGNTKQEAELSTILKLVNTMLILLE